MSFGLGLLLGTETPVMTPLGTDFCFIFSFLYTLVVSTQGATCL